MYHIGSVSNFRNRKNRNAAFFIPTVTQYELYRDEQPPSTQQETAPKGKGAVITNTNAAPVVGLELYPCGVVLHQLGRYRRYSYCGELEKVGYIIRRQGRNEKIDIEKFDTG